MIIHAWQPDPALPAGIRPLPRIDPRYSDWGPDRVLPQLLDAAPGERVVYIHAAYAQAWNGCLTDPVAWLRSKANTATLRDAMIPLLEGLKPAAPDLILVDVEFDGFTADTGNSLYGNWLARVQAEARHLLPDHLVSAATVSALCGNRWAVWGAVQRFMRQTLTQGIREGLLDPARDILGRHATVANYNDSAADRVDRLSLPSFYGADAGTETWRRLTDKLPAEFAACGPENVMPFFDKTGAQFITAAKSLGMQRCFYFNVGTYASADPAALFGL